MYADGYAIREEGKKKRIFLELVSRDRQIDIVASQVEFSALLSVPLDPHLTQRHFICPPQNSGVKIQIAVFSSSALSALEMSILSFIPRGLVHILAIKHSPALQQIK